VHSTDEDEQMPHFSAQISIKLIGNMGYVMLATQVRG
jgi:hypothetical protein